MGTGLEIIILSALPAILYIVFLHLTVPARQISLGTSFAYLMIGLTSVGLLEMFWLAYPDWLSLTDRWIGAITSKNALSYLHFNYFIQVGFIEELSKLAVFIILDRFRRNHGKIDSPSATMMQMGMVALGFAIVENISYGVSQIGSADMTPANLLFWRNITAVIAHLVFGLFMGYWIGLGRLKRKFQTGISIFDNITRNTPRISSLLYMATGLFCATILHGLYDLNISIGMAVANYILLIGSLLGSYWCFSHLSKMYKKHSEKLSS